MGTYYVRRSSNNEYHWNLTAANGEKILQSELYTTRGAAFGGISSCKENSPLPARYQRRTAVNGQPYFNLVAANGQVIGTSETYSSLQAMEGGIAACQAHGPSSSVRDETGER